MKFQGCAKNSGGTIKDIPLRSGGLSDGKPDGLTGDTSLIQPSSLRFPVRGKREVGAAGGQPEDGSTRVREKGTVHKKSSGEDCQTR